MRINFKKVSAIATSALMLSLTVGTAVAANYPSPFVSGGVADVAVVYGTGSGVSSLDLVQAGNLQSDLAAELGTDGTSGGGSSVSGGDSYKFEKYSTKFHIGDNYSTITTVVDDDELPNLLADGKYVDDDNEEFDYTQKIEMNASELTMFEDNDYMEDSPTVGFRIASGYNVLNYTLTFVDQPDIGDLPSSNLPLMGKIYYVLSNTTSGANLVLNLLDSAEDAVITEGETTTVAGHSVSIAFIDSDEVKLMIDDETTNSLNEAETQKLSDGSYVGIKDILFNSKDTGISSVEFSIGAGKLELISGSNIKINDETINGITAVITNASGTATNVGGTLSSIEIEWKTDDDSFITEDTSMTMPGFGIVKLSYGGVTYPAEEEIKVEQGSDTYIMLNDFPVKYGPVDIPLLYGADGAYTGLGKDASNALVTSNSTDEAFPVIFDKDTDAMLIVTYESATECESYALKATSFGLDGAENNKTTLQVYKDGAWADERDVKAGDTFSLGSAELGVAMVQRSPANNVSLTANSSSTKFNVLCSEEGIKLTLPWTYNDEPLNSTTKIAGWINLTAGGGSVTTGNHTAGHNGTTFYLQMEEEDKDGNVGDGDEFNISLGWSTGTGTEPEVSDLIGEDVTAVEIGDTDVFRSFMYSALATEFLWNKPSSSQDSIKIMYHGDEVAADVYITSPEATVTPGAGTGDSALGDILVKDSEVSTVSSKNLIVVGGSCINSVAASLLGSGCGSDFTSKTGVGSNQFLIQSLTSPYASNQIALVVAGYEAADTVNAATYLRTQTVDTTVGKKYKGTSSTSAELVVE